MKEKIVWLLFVIPPNVATLVFNFIADRAWGVEDWLWSLFVCWVIWCFAWSVLSDIYENIYEFLKKHEDIGIDIRHFFTVHDEYDGKTIDADIVDIMFIGNDVIQLNLSIDGKRCYYWYCIGTHYFNDRKKIRNAFEKGGYKANISVLRDNIGALGLKLNHFTKDGVAIAIPE